MDRYDGNLNKFNLTVVKETGDGQKIERLREFVDKRVDDVQLKNPVFKFIADEEYETDAVELDVAEPEDSNLWSMGQVIGDAINKFEKMHRVTTNSLSSGFLFSYWEWYEERTDADVKHMR